MVDEVDKGGEAAQPRRIARWWARLRSRFSGAAFLGLEDRAERVASAAAIGFAIGVSPTMGIQLVLYAAVAAVLPINRLAGLPFLFVSNPVTAIPLYYGEWRLGVWLRDVWDTRSPLISEQALPDGILDDPNAATKLLEVLWQLGIEVWIGAAVVGSPGAAICYVGTFWAVRRLRRRTEAAGAAEPAP